MAEVESVSGGLVTARDPSLLQSGELTESTDLCYVPGSPAVHRAPGRVALPAAALSNPKGLAYCGFDSFPDQLVALANGQIYTRDVDGSLAFAALGAQSGSTLDAVQYNDRHVLLTGSTNVVLRPDGTPRQHGMAPVTSPPGLEHAGVGGTFPAPTPGVYTYWTTEVYISGTEAIESGNTGATATVTVTATTSIVTISRPPQVNANATHWRVYRSAAGGSYPIGYRIGERPITANDPNTSTDSFIDGASTGSGLQFPTTATSIMVNDTIRGIFAIGVPGTFDVPICANAWTDPGNITADDAAYAVFSTSPCPVTSVPVAALEISGFAFGTVNDPVMRIEIEIQAQNLIAFPNSVTFAISGNGGLTLYPKRVTVGIGTALTTATATIQSDSGHPFHASDFGASFRLYLLAWRYMKIDYVKVQVYHAGTTGDVATLYDAIQIKVGGQSLVMGANGPPPRATTGDIFQESLVLNDVDHPSRAAYSMAGNIDAFPEEYILNFQTKDKDRLACIRTVGSVCLFGLTSQVLRANYLPREEDAEFDRGRCVEIVDADNGIPGIFCACRIVLDGRMTLFFVSRSGPRMTDGFRADTANEDLDWPNTVDVNRLSSAIVVNNAERQEVLVYYAPPGSSAITRYLRFQYHPTHLKNGKLKAIGPCGVSAVAAAIGTSVNGERVLYTLNPSGVVYQENRGLTDESGVGILPRLSSREIYHAGIGGEWQLNRAFVHHEAMPSSELTANYTVVRANSAERVTAPRTIRTPNRGLSLVVPAEGGEGITMHLALNDVAEDQAINYLLLDGESLGPATPLSNA